MLSGHTSNSCLHTTPPAPFERPPLPVEALHRHTRQHDNKQQNNNNQTIVPNSEEKDRKTKVLNEDRFI